MQGEGTIWWLRSIHKIWIQFRDETQTPAIFNFFQDKKITVNYNIVEWLLLLNERK